MSSPQHRQDWERPPVIEVVVGIQFDQLPSLTNGHLGWFWSEMHREFPKADDAAPIPPVVEVLGKEGLFEIPALGIRPATGDSRLRMTSGDGTRMLQVQNGWFVANWIKAPDHGYPGFEGVKEQFDTALKSFEAFLVSHSLGNVKPNLWEVTYIDHIPRGTVWNSLPDLPRVFPGLFGNARCPSGSSEAVNSTWVWRLVRPPGRLRVSVQSARATADPDRDILLVRSVARGPLGSENHLVLDECLNLGRAVVVDTFMELTSEEARGYWRGDGPC